MNKSYSVLMSVYKNEKPEYMETAIKSMLGQTVPPEQIVIVKDGELTDELNAMLDNFSSAHEGVFTVVVSEKNIGLGAALHLGTKYCRNELIARMDTDDISLPLRCEKQLALFDSKPELDIVGTMSSDFTNDPDNIISTRIVPTKQQDIYEFAKRRSPFNHISVMFKKSSVEKFNGYSDLRRNQDADLFGRMMFGGCNAENIDEVLVLARMTHTRKARRKSWDNISGNIKIIRNFYKIGYAGLGDLIIVTAAQVFIYMCPIKLQQFIYKKFLRK